MTKLANKKISYYVGKMIEGLENPDIKIDMSSFGMKLTSDDFCFGCAATACIFKIKKMKKYKEATRILLDRAFEYKEEAKTVVSLEKAIDGLRLSDLKEFVGHITIISKPISYVEQRIIRLYPKENDLPVLGDKYTQEQLIPYKQFHQFLLEYKL